MTQPAPRRTRLTLLGGGGALADELPDHGEDHRAGAPAADPAGADPAADPFADQDDVDGPGWQGPRSEEEVGRLPAGGRWGVPVLAAAALLVLAAVVALVLGVRAGVLTGGRAAAGTVAAQADRSAGAGDGSAQDGAAGGSVQDGEGAGAAGVVPTGPVVGGAVDGPTREPGPAGGPVVPEGSGATGSTGAVDGAGGASLTVHVVGAVAAPGVVTVGPGARAVDAVAAAGGMTAEADPGGVNLARALTDGEQVVVPRPGEVVAPAPPPGAAAPGGGPSGPAALVDLNTAGPSELDSLPGIGPVLAQRIVETREAHGAFTAVEELVEVPGIGDAVLERVRPLVRV